MGLPSQVPRVNSLADVSECVSRCVLAVATTVLCVRARVRCVCVRVCVCIVCVCVSLVI